MLPASIVTDFSFETFLLGTDQVDDHSDEENASVSQSESQWSHLGPWDDDPEIQEKVK